MLANMDILNGGKFLTSHRIVLTIEKISVEKISALRH